MRLHRLALIPATGALALLVATSPAGAGGRPLSADLTGAAEVPRPGDPDGRGTAFVTVNPGQGEICFDLNVSGIAPATAAHIHEAPAGQAGPVVVTLTAPTSGSSSDCVAVGRAQAKDILKNSSDYYVNVHNAEFPAGALRGQL
ncbi:MAG: CHRD domain-containing protein [Actinobacteria bacterium]|nr:CHRD domain-containing protein [Actinomycetota bacterium]